MKQAANLLLLDTLITEMSSGRGMRCIRETELRGITGVWTPVNLFICRGPPPEKAALLRLNAHLLCLSAYQHATPKSYPNVKQC